MFTISIEGWHSRHTSGTRSRRSRMLSYSSSTAFRTARNRASRNTVALMSKKWSIRQYGDVAFTIAGVKPCALLALGGEPWYAKALVEAALLPLMGSVGGLAEAGFELREITHPFISEIPRHPG